MTPYSAALFLHLCGALLFFVGLAIEWLCVASLRRAATVEQVMSWHRLSNAGPRLAGPGFGILLLTGGYLAANMGAWRQGWIQITMLAIVLIALTGLLVTAPRMRMLGRMLSSETPVMSSALRKRSQDPLLTASVRFRVALALGIVFLMASKQPLAQSLITLAVAAILGTLAAATAWRPHREAPSAT